MARFTDIAAKVAISVEVAQTGPIPPEQTFSAPFGSAPAPGIPMGSSSTAQGGMQTGLQMGMPQPAPGGALIRSDQPQPQPGMQTSQSLPQTKAPGASKAFQAPKPSAAPAAPKLMKPSTAPPTAMPKKASLLSRLKLAFVGAPVIPRVLEGLGMRPDAMAGGMVDKAFGSLEAAHRAKLLFDIPSNVASAVDAFRGSPATEVLEKRANHGFPVTPPPAGQMPISPAAQFGSFMDVVQPLKTPVQSTKAFISGLGDEADSRLTRSMIEQPVTIHQMQFQQHPTVTN